jgi:hypothetical protein
MGCSSGVEPDTTWETAKCHLCGDVRLCGYCTWCEHWFCRDCNPRLIARSLAAAKQLLGGPTPGCCGPLVSS